MAVLYTDEQFIVEQGFFGYSFKVTHRVSGAAIKLTGPLQDRAAQLWLLVRKYRGVATPVARRGEDLMFSMVANAAFDPDGNDYFTLMTRSPAQVAQTIINAAKASFEPPPAAHDASSGWSKLFEDHEFILRVSTARVLQVLWRSEHEWLTATDGERRQFIRVMDALGVDYPAALAPEKQLWRRTFCRALAAGATSPLYQTCITQDAAVVAFMISTAR